ncbi:hypothetical protein MKW98_032079, partial [Papaver atlanticum]
MRCYSFSIHLEFTVLTPSLGSNCNTASTTVDGVDVVGERLADEALFFKSGGPEHRPSEGNGGCSGDGTGIACLEKKSIVKIAILEPMNYVTVAAPHICSRGHKKVPVFGGLRFLEKQRSTHLGWLGKLGSIFFSFSTIAIYQGLILLLDFDFKILIVVYQGLILLL